MIEVELNLEGMPVTLVDTAGLRETEDAVERIGVGRARARAGEADLLLWLSEGGAAPPPDVETDGAEILRIAAKADEFPPTPGVWRFPPARDWASTSYAKKSPRERARCWATAPPRWLFASAIATAEAPRATCGRRWRPAGPWNSSPRR